MLIVTNISCLDGGKKSILWRLGQLLEVMDELCRSQNDFFFIVLKAQSAQLGVWGDFVGGIGQTISIPGFYLWCVGIPVVTISARSLKVYPSAFGCEEEGEIDPPVPKT